MLPIRHQDPLSRVRSFGDRHRRSQHATALRSKGPHEGWWQVGQPGAPQFGGIGNAPAFQPWHNATRDPITGYDFDQAPAGFYKDNDSLVWFRGIVERRYRAWEHSIFVLPVGYRPAWKIVLPTSDEPISILPDGRMLPEGLQKQVRARPPSSFGTKGGFEDFFYLTRVFSLEALHFRAAG